MMQNTIMFSILAVIATVIVCFIVSTFLLYYMTHVRARNICKILYLITLNIFLKIL